jgi:hypothetical protein
LLCLFFLSFFPFSVASSYRSLTELFLRTFFVPFTMLLLALGLSAVISVLAQNAGTFQTAGDTGVSAMMVRLGNSPFLCSLFIPNIPDVYRQQKECLRRRQSRR